MKDLFTSLKKSFYAARPACPVSQCDRRKSMSELGRMSDNQLQDLGLDRGTFQYFETTGKAVKLPKKVA